MEENQVSTSEDVCNDLARRIRSRREHLGLTQEMLAKASGLGSPQILSQIERGERDVKAFELYAFAQALYCSVLDLIGDPALSLPVAWRNNPQESLAIEQERFLQMCHSYHLVEQWTETDNSFETPLPAIQHTPLHVTQQWAQSEADYIRDELKLGNYPAFTLRKTLEDLYGVKIFFLPNLKGSAASTRGPFGEAIVINTSETSRRQIYSIAHELFHLLTWTIFHPELNDDTYIWNFSLERAAEAFASSLLLPQHLIRERVDQLTKNNRLTGRAIVTLADEFNVSRQALVWRLVNLEYLKADQAQQHITKSAYLQEPRNHLDANSPIWPERFMRLLRIAYLRGEIAVGRIAEMLGQTLPDVRVMAAQWEEDDSDAETDLRLA